MTKHLNDSCQTVSHQPPPPPSSLPPSASLPSSSSSPSPSIPFPSSFDGYRADTDMLIHQSSINQNQNQNQNQHVNPTDMYAEIPFHPYAYESSVPVDVDDHVNEAQEYDEMGDEEDEDENADGADAGGNVDNVDEEDELNEVDDTPKAILINDDDMMLEQSFQTNSTENGNSHRQPSFTASMGGHPSTSNTSTITSTAPFNANESSSASNASPSTFDDASDSEYEVNDDPHCYCRLPWDGDEKMIECDVCSVWFHFDCMGIPLTREFGDDEKWRCDACLSAIGLPNNIAQVRRRDRVSEKLKRDQRSALRRASREMKRNGMTKEQIQQHRASLKKQQKEQKKQAKAASKAIQVKKKGEERVAGVKSLLASFDESSSSDDDTDSSNSSSDSNSNSDADTIGSTDSNNKSRAKTAIHNSKNSNQPMRSVEGNSRTNGNNANANTNTAFPTAAASASASLSGGGLLSPTSATKKFPSSTSSPSHIVKGLSGKMSTLWEPIRAKVRKSFESLVGASLSVEIEAALFNHFRSPNKMYLAQCRDIAANLKDQKNDFKQRLMNGRIVIESLATMSTADFASTEMSQMRQQIKQEAMKDSVRPVSPPRDKLMQHRAKSLIATEGESASDALMNQAISTAGSANSIRLTEEQKNGGGPSPIRSKLSETIGTSATSSSSSSPSTSSLPTTSSLLASLPKLGSYEEVIQSYQQSKQEREKMEQEMVVDDITAESNAHLAKRKEQRKEIQAKRSAVLAAANAQLANDAAVAVATATAMKKRKREEPKEYLNENGVTILSSGVSPSSSNNLLATVSSSTSRSSAAASSQTVTKKQRTWTTEEELQFESLSLPPMEVWSGDLLLAAGANPSVLSSYLPLTARQVAGPPVITIPLPARIEESLRLKVEEVHKYLELVIARGSKKVVIVDMALNAPASSSAMNQTLKEDYAAFSANYARKERALAFDFQKDAEVTNRLLLYVLPPSTGSWLSTEFIRRRFSIDKPQGLWGILILPKETYLPIAKRISKIHLAKMQAQAAAMEQFNKEQEQAHANTHMHLEQQPQQPPQPTSRVIPSDPRRPQPATSATTSARPADATAALTSLLTSNALTDLLSKLVPNAVAGATTTTTTATSASADSARSSFPAPPSTHMPTSATSMQNQSQSSFHPPTIPNSSTQPSATQTTLPPYDTRFGPHQSVASHTPFPVTNSYGAMPLPPHGLGGYANLQQPSPSQSVQTSYPALPSPSNHTPAPAFPPPNISSFDQRPAAHQHHQYISNSTMPPIPQKHPAPLQQLQPNLPPAPHQPFPSYTQQSHVSAPLPSQTSYPPPSLPPPMHPAPSNFQSRATHPLPPPPLPASSFPSSSPSSSSSYSAPMCTFYFGPRGCAKHPCRFSHDVHSIAAVQYMREKGIPPHLRGLVNEQEVYPNGNMISNNNQPAPHLYHQQQQSPQPTHAHQQQPHHNQPQSAFRSHNLRPPPSHAQGGHFQSSHPLAPAPGPHPMPQQIPPIPSPAHVIAPMQQQQQQHHHRHLPHQQVNHSQPHHGFPPPPAPMHSPPVQVSVPYPPQPSHFQQPPPAVGNQQQQPGRPPQPTYRLAGAGASSKIRIL